MKTKIKFFKQSNRKVYDQNRSNWIHTSHADALKALLDKLGYKNQSGIYTHPDRKVVFIGDYIDRGLQVPETLKIVRDMLDSGSATALMGNHEYNAICFHTDHSNGGHLRRHLIKNIKQHAKTFLQFQNRQHDYDR